MVDDGVAWAVADVRLCGRGTFVFSSKPKKPRRVLRTIKKLEYFRETVEDKFLCFS